MMEHVWINLINNAIKYTKNNGTICVSLNKINNKIIFEIKDNGIGMDENTISRIFEEYYQGNTSHGQEGIGIGLSIVKKIIDLNNGKLEVESKINEGSIFRVIL